MNENAYLQGPLVARYLKQALRRQEFRLLKHKTMPLFCRVEGIRGVTWRGHFQFRCAASEGEKIIISIGSAPAMSLSTAEKVADAMRITLDVAEPELTRYGLTQRLQNTRDRAFAPEPQDEIPAWMDAAE